MTPKRLPRPGEVVEPCRLCGAALELSVENPRRVCAACGEINLPSDLASPDTALRPRTSAARLELPLTAPLMIGAATPVVSAIAALLSVLASRDSGFEWLFRMAVFLPLATLVSLTICVALMVKEGANKVTVAASWALSYFASVGLTALVAWVWMIASSLHR